MEINMVFKMIYDPQKDVNLSKFRDKYLAFRGHVERLQVLGQLPRGDVKWSVERKPTGPDGPRPPARILGFSARQGQALVDALPLQHACIAA